MRNLLAGCLVLFLSVSVFGQAFVPFVGGEKLIPENEGYRTRWQEYGPTCGLFIKMPQREGILTFFKFNASYFAFKGNEMHSTDDLRYYTVAPLSPVPETFQLNISGNFMIGPEIKINQKLMFSPMLCAGVIRKGQYEKITKCYESEIIPQFGLSAMCMYEMMNFKVGIMGHYTRSLETTTGTGRLELLLLL